MALISPTLDNRTYDQLRDELIKRMPVYTSEMTDLNESNPAVALLELFAYLGESTLYRFNQIPETTKIAFLRLLGVAPRTAQPARTLIVASTELPEGVTIDRAALAEAGTVGFETEGAITVWPLDIVGAGKKPIPTKKDHVDEDEAKAEEERRADALHRAGNLEADAADFYETAQVPTDPQDPDAQSLDVAGTLDRSLWIALIAKPTTEIGKLSGRGVTIGFGFDAVIDRAFALQEVGPSGAAKFRSDGLTTDPPPMLWRLWHPPDVNDSDVKKRKAYFTSLDIGNDTTFGLTRTGTVEVLLPPSMPRLDPPDPNHREYGSTDWPPPLLDDKQASNVIAWIQVSRPDIASRRDEIHDVNWIGMNAVGLVQSRAASAEFLGSGDGDSDQRFALAHRPVLASTIKLEVEEADGWREWQEVEAYRRGAADDRYFTLDYIAGSVSFDKRRVPQPGQRIRVLTYRFGGGSAGNVAAKAISSIDGVDGITVENPFPAAGGYDAGSLDDALDEVPSRVHRRDRAVIAEDFTNLALEVTGVGRADTLPLVHPDRPELQSPGVVTVVIFPDADSTNPQMPIPDFALLRCVAAYLDVRRLLTTELYVIPPTYRGIAVSVGLSIRPGYQVDAVRQWVGKILRQYLAPLPPFGPDGAGWPRGRRVHRAELEAVAVQVEGVEFVVDKLRLAVYDRKSESFSEIADEMTLEKWEVPHLMDIEVGEGKPITPATHYKPPPPPKPPLPLPPSVC